MLSRVLVLLGVLDFAATCELPDFLVNGKCANVKVQEKFDMRKYAGLWYQTEIIKNAYQPYTKCINSFYDYSDDDCGYRVAKAGFSPKYEYLRLDVMGYPYQVIETDYDTNSCVYSCLNWNTYKTEFAFVFSRSPQNARPATDQCKEVFTKNGINFSRFQTVPHTSECIYTA